MDERHVQSILLQNQAANDALQRWRRNILSAAIALVMSAFRARRKKRKRRIWVSKLLQLRPVHGFFNAIMPELILNDNCFFNYMRMSAIQFEELLQLIAPRITKLNAVRAPIPAAERLALTLRFLATGDCVTSMMYHYLIAQPTVSCIIKETCTAIWDILQPLVLTPCTENTWKGIARDFERLWNFPHCCGAIDGRHIEIDCLPHAGSQFYNYKGYHSIVLMAVCDAKYLFRCVDIGACGRRGDAGIFRQGPIGHHLENKTMNLPPPQPLYEGGVNLPYVFVGDEAFPLSSYMMRPYPGRLGLSREKKILNYRLSRCRRMIENTFGIIVSQWRILRKPMECKVDLARDIVKAIVCLHNWLGKHNLNRENYIDRDMVDREDTRGNFYPGQWRAFMNESALRLGLRHFLDNTNNTIVAKYVRDEFCRYFDEEGEVPWQAKAIGDAMDEG